MQVGVMVTSYNHGDWDRLMAGDYSHGPAIPDSEKLDETLRMGELVEPLGFDSIWTTETTARPTPCSPTPCSGWPTGRAAPSGSTWAAPWSSPPGGTRCAWPTN